MYSYLIKNTKTSYLIKLIRIQVVTKRKTKKVTQNKNPLVKEIIPNLINLIFKSQRNNPLCIQLKKELISQS